MMAFLRIASAFLVLQCALGGPSSAANRNFRPSSVPSTSAARKFFPNVPNGLLRSIAAVNKRPTTSGSLSGHHVQEVAVKTKKLRERKLPLPSRPSNEQIHRQLSSVGFFYGMTPGVVNKSTMKTSFSDDKSHPRKKQLALRDTMKETLDEIKSMRQELEALRRDMRAIRRQMGGEESSADFDDDETTMERGVGAMMARRKRLREFEKIGKDVEEWAKELLFSQDGEVDGWEEIKCNKVMSNVFNKNKQTKAYMKWFKDSRGKHATKDDDREYPCMKIYASIDAPLETVCSYLSNESTMGEYNELVVRHRDVEELTPNSKICWGQTPQLLFIKPRTFVTFCHHRWLRDGTQVVLNQACEHEGEEASAYALRGATYIGRDPDDPEKTRISLLTHASPGSDIPAWASKTAIKALAPIEPFKLFHNINEGAKRARSELQPDLNDTEMVGMPGRISRPAGLSQMGFACFWPNGGGIKEGLCTEPQSSPEDGPSDENNMRLGENED